jgi:hypothetical protein
VAIGKLVSVAKGREGFSEVALELADLLRVRPDSGGVMTALHHMWRRVSSRSPAPLGTLDAGDPKRLLRRVQEAAKACREPYLLASTALSELEAWRLLR